MMIPRRAAQAVFAAAMIGLGMLGLIYGNSALLWEQIPKGLPGREPVIYLCSAIALGSGIGLLVRPWAVRVLFPFLLLWLILVKLPGVLMAPQVVVNWESFAEVAAPCAGAWCLFGGRHIKFARWLFIAALPMIGLSHFAYPGLTASLVPKWLGFPLFWTYFTGAASIAAASGMLLGIRARLAANLEAAMMWIITVLVWVPRVASMPANQENWTEIAISCAIASGAWLVAETYRSET